MELCNKNGKDNNLYEMSAYVLFLVAALIFIRNNGGTGGQTIIFSLVVGAFVLLMHDSEALVAALHAIPFLGVFAFGGLTALVSTLGIILVVFIWRILRNVKSMANLPVVLLLTFFVYAVVSLYLNNEIDREFGMQNLRLYLIRGVAPCLLIMTFNQPLQRFRTYYAATLVFTSMSVALSILAYVGYVQVTIDPGGRFSMFGFDPISFSLPFGVACVIAYHVLLNSERKYTRPLAALSLCTSFVAIVPTGTRQTFVALAAGILAYTYFAYPSLIKRVVMGLISCTLISLALFTVVTKVGGQRYDVTSSKYDREGSFKGRIVTMQRGLDTFFEAPLLGVGSRGHGKFFYTIDPRSGKQNRDKEHIHNLFIELLAEYGLVGFALFMAALVIAVRRMVGDLRQDGLNPVVRSNYSLLIGLIVFAVVQANISGGLAVSGGFISMLIAWTSIMPNVGPLRKSLFSEDIVPSMVESNLHC